MKLLFDIAALGRGGMERQVLTLAEGLQARGHDARIVVNQEVTGYGEVISSANLDVLELGAGRGIRPGVVLELVRLARAMNADVIVGVNFNATLYSRLASMFVGIPAVTAEHSTDRGAPLKVRLANRALSGATSAIVACARAQVPSLVDEGNPSRLIRVIPNGVDADRFRMESDAGKRFRRDWGIPEAALIVGIVAAHRREKRYDRFIELIARLRDRGLDVVGVGVGSGQLLEDNREAASASRVSDRIRFIGGLEDVASAYSAFDVCVLVSDAVETFPMCFLEAQASSLPVAALDVGGVSETMRSGVTGVLVPQDALSTLADEVSELLQDPARRAAMGDAGRQLIRDELSAEAMVTAYEMLFGDIIKSRGDS